MIETVEFYNYRNYQSLNLSLGPNLNVFIGSNGQGKTNFVEGLNLLLTGSFLRTKKLSDIIKLESAEGFVSAEVSHLNQKNNN